MKSNSKILRRTCALLLLAFTPVLAAADENALPSWSIEVKTGRFYPDIDDWNRFYGKDRIDLIGGAFAYKIFDFMDFGIESFRVQDKGKGLRPVSQTLGGRVTYELYPVNVFLSLQARFSQGQWIVPYIAGGWTRAYYKEEIEQQEDKEGSADGTHYRGGLRILLDPLDRRSAGRLQRSTGIDNSYLFLEYHHITAEIDSVDLGGESYTLGVALEY